MFTKKYKGIWFYGLSGSGKTIASKFLKKKIKNSILLDGDKIRKYISFDLGYSISERKIQLTRVYGLVRLAIESKIFPIASTVYMNNKTKKELEKNNIFLLKIVREFKKIKNRKSIYNSKQNNVIGKDIKNPKLNKEFKIENNKTIKVLQKKLERLIYE